MRRPRERDRRLGLPKPPGYTRTLQLTSSRHSDYSLVKEHNLLIDIHFRDCLSRFSLWLFASGRTENTLVSVLVNPFGDDFFGRLATVEHFSSLSFKREEHRVKLDKNFVKLDQKSYHPKSSNSNSMRRSMPSVWHLTIHSAVRHWEGRYYSRLCDCQSRRVIFSNLRVVYQPNSIDRATLRDEESTGRVGFGCIRHRPEPASRPPDRLAKSARLSGPEPFGSGVTPVGCSTDGMILSSYLGHVNTRHYRIVSSKPS